MRISTSAQYTLSIGAAVAILAGCNNGGSQLAPSVSTQAVPVTQVGSAATINNPQRADKKRKHARYTLIDIGTFGGPNSQVSWDSLLSGPVLNARGTLVGWADTPRSDRFPAFCFNATASLFAPDCYIARGFMYSNGVMTRLPALGPDSAAAAEINDTGLISGIAQNGKTDPQVPGFPELRAVVWADGKIKNLGTFGGNESLIGSLNDRGQVVGSALNTVPDPYSFMSLFILNNSTKSTQTRAFLWENDVKRDLGTLGGPDASGYFVNRRGQVTGFSYINNTPNSGTNLPTMHPFLWTPWDDRGHGKMRDLGTLGGTLVYGISGLNERGEVAGAMTVAGDVNANAFLWNGERLKNLGTLGGSQAFASALNNAGEVVGWAETGKNCPGDGAIHHSFLWKDGHMKDLGNVSSTQGSEPFWINSKAQVVGNSFACDNSYFTSYLWENGSILDLNRLIPSSSSLHVFYTVEINDRGEIAGIGSTPNGDAHAFLLIPNSGTRGDNTQALATPRKITAAEVNLFHAFMAARHHGIMRFGRF